MQAMRLPFLFLVPLLLASSGFPQAGGRGPVRLVITPGDMLMPPNASQPLKAAISYLGGFANPGAQRNVSAAVAWSSSDKAIATVDSKGIVTSASQTGAVVITARAGPLVAKVPLTVSTATLSGISVSPGTVALPLGRRPCQTAPHPRGRQARSRVLCPLTVGIRERGGSSGELTPWLANL